MTPVIVHGIPGSPFVRAVLATLEEKRLPWRLNALAPPQHKAPEHLARHPFGRVPAIEHDGFALYETGAILRYIDRVAPEPALTPGNPRAEARMNQAMSLVDWYLFPAAAAIVFPRVVAPRLGLAADDSGVAEALPKAKVSIDALAAVLGDQPFIAGDSLSLADLHAGPQIDFFAMTPEGRELMSAHPPLVAWLERMTARPSFEATTWEAVAALAKAA